jgi:hypothetical protein
MLLSTPTPNLEMIASNAAPWAFVPFLLAVIRQDACKTKVEMI